MYFVGGCVRDKLLNKPISDIDMATDATPSEMMDMFDMKDIDYKPLGVAFGSLIVKPQEICITSFREDIKAYGRKVDVSFTKSLEKDSARRDFTINALYADYEGNIIDPQQGMSDLKNKRVRFIGSPYKRINEDYLRILRFFRFSSIYGETAKRCDQDGLAAIKKFDADKFDLVSGFRLRTEITRILSIRPLYSVLLEWQQTPCWKRFFPDGQAKAHERLEELEAKYQIKSNPITSLAVLNINDESSGIIYSSPETAKLKILSKFTSEMDQPIEELAYWYGREMTEAIVLTRAALGIKAIKPDFKARLDYAATRIFPIKAGDIIARFKGKELGEKLRYLEREWISSGFALSRTALLQKF